ncbi:hypothetical protein F7725_008866 [Dissostichus mawsoni]|uniref:Uncharacterized protein n=1 Tax=Dissostichus mawsoni TaxID=36200 RepID=A0A7J5Z8H9_DISMA|nr:hypothetical protein F7725_008866 [Dissostichus mawsoni]
MYLLWRSLLDTEWYYSSSSIETYCHVVGAPLLRQDDLCDLGPTLTLTPRSFCSTCSSRASICTSSVISLRNKQYSFIKNLQTEGSMSDPSL